MSMLPDGPYNPSVEEPKILDFWLKNSFYKPEYNPDKDVLDSFDEFLTKKEETWCLICPPPNAYARPHIGNISGYAYQDAMARFARMTGKRVLMIPGKDHAGLEGEAIFIREILEKQGKRKSDFSREEFYAQIMEFFKRNMALARHDEQIIGLSADFDRDIFTLDPRVVDIVLDTFIEMYKKGMIYKGVRIVNWDTKARTAVADNQVIFQEVNTPFYYFKYLYGDVDDRAIELKNKMQDRTVSFFVKRISSDTDFKLQDNYYIQYQFLLEDKNIECIPIGFSKQQILSANSLSGRVIGIEMRLDKRYRLIVSNLSYEGDIRKEMFKVWQMLLKHNQNLNYTLTPGSHFILFSDYEDEKFYRNGFVIGTVRPETIFGDTAIACNPNDKRYKQFVGHKIEVEFLGNKKTLSFIEDYCVDMNFGTGLLKVTPAHSVEDWEISSRHPNECLPPIQVINKDLKMNILTGFDYEGLSIKDARIKLEQDMHKFGNLVYIDQEYKTNIKIAERTKAQIEPLLSSQWYLSYDVPIDGGKTLRQAAIDMVKHGEVRIHPKGMESKFFHWMENLRDWAISRTLWWGYRLPVWYHGDIKEIINSEGQIEELIQLYGTNEWIPIDYSNPNHMKVQKESPGEGWYQDESVLDTWFSSGQWVYATLMSFGLIDKFFPTNVMCSGFDILENWDTRMMMFTYFKTKKIPFRDLYLTGLVLGTDGQKMSKSKGNIIDIDKVRDEYGTDALRLAYFYQNSAGANYAITYEKLKTFKQFCNKIWNAGKFILKYVEFYDAQILESSYGIDLNNALVKKIRQHLSDVKKRVIKNIKSFKFGLATYNLYQNFWHFYCDILIEESKSFLIDSTDLLSKKQVVSFMLDAFKEYLKLLHPFIPFITERIWQELPKKHGEHRSIMYTRIL